jgi:hypothetical protein
MANPKSGAGLIFIITFVAGPGLVLRAIKPVDPGCGMPKGHP